ncbi:unnamed protein product [Spirodela intermedia]|uniref:Uncharacterized protein n=1 Tax=Spirodela intermedia TaxID=51605 RepID=A0A7I8KVZ7_SPIIN|nr:unnamed protein product [Spirodela intermedia]
MGLLLLLLLSSHLLSIAGAAEPHWRPGHHLRKVLYSEEDGEQAHAAAAPPPPPKKTTTANLTVVASAAAGKNQTKLLLKANSTAAAVKVPKPSNSSLLLKPSNATKLATPIKPINSTTAARKTTTATTKAVNSTTTAGGKTTTTTTTKALNSTTSTVTGKKTTTSTATKAVNSTTSAGGGKLSKTPPAQKSSESNPGGGGGGWFLSGYDPSEEDTDLIAEFRDLPSRFQETLLPDLAKISSTSKVYLSKASKEITRGVKPIVGHRYAATVASATSAAFILLPLLLVAALLRHVRSFLSLPRILLFAHAYLAIYFSVLFLAAVLTGVEPLRLFYVASPAAYLSTQVLQTLGYAVFLLLHLLHLLVAPARAVALLQAGVALAVGLHYYTAVFHRAVAGEAPRTNWRAHALYAACFLILFAFSRAADRRKKAYLLAGPGGDDSKNS